MDLKRFFHLQFRLRAKVKLPYIKVLAAADPRLVHLQVPKFVLRYGTDIEGPMVHDFIDPLLVQMYVAVSAAHSVNSMATENLRFIRTHFKILTAYALDKTAVFHNGHMSLFKYIQTVSSEPGHESTPLITVHHYRLHKADVRRPLVIHNLEHLASVAALVVDVLKDFK